MASNIFVLSAGINTYPQAHISNLEGCENDVHHLCDYLESQVNPELLHVEKLLGFQATRQALIYGFRNHLMQAGPDDVVLFHFSGHGSREPGAPEFQKFDPDGLEETLVCFDSRGPDGLDLADKELAVLLSEVGKNHPHLVVLLDCCHSGSGTRDLFTSNLLKSRQTSDREDHRDLDQYLDGYYAKLLDAGNELHIPSSRHILMSACRKTQKAWERRDQKGLFTDSLLKVLKDGIDKSYAGLYLNCNAHIRRSGFDQNPQFEPYHHFNSYSSFLNLGDSHQGVKLSVYFTDGQWCTDMGALHGLPTDKASELKIYDQYGEDLKVPQPFAKTTKVAAQKSYLQLEFEGDTDINYQGEVLSIPLPPTLIYLEADDKEKEILLDHPLRDSLGIQFVENPAGIKYSLVARDGDYRIYHLESQQLLQGIQGDREEMAEHVFQIFRSIINWERTSSLQNEKTQFDSNTIEFDLLRRDPVERQIPLEDEVAHLNISKIGASWQKPKILLRARNNSTQDLFVNLFYFSPNYQIISLYGEQLSPGGFTTLWGDKDGQHIFLPEHKDEMLDTFRLYVSTDEINSFLLEQKGIKLGKITELGGKGIGKAKSLGGIGDEDEINIIENDWFVKTIHIHSWREKDQLSKQDISLADNFITIHGHPSIVGNLSMGSTSPNSRSVDGFDGIARFLKDQDLDLINLSKTRGALENCLVINDIKGDEKLQEEPLIIDLNTKLSDQEYILPLTFDGEHILPVASFEKTHTGGTRIKITDIPPNQDPRQRSLGKALKLCFCKLVLKSKNVQKLRWVDYLQESIKRTDQDLKDQVQGANRVLMLIHGIIGDTKEMAESMEFLVKDQHYDLILTFDYENLNTTIEESAKALKEHLAKAGIDDKFQGEFHILAHSMGGLVSRYFIENLGGHQVVQQLIMAGTPNQGSAFSKIEQYRGLATTIFTLSANFNLGLPAAAAVLVVLNQMANLTTTLGQMNESSPFTDTLKQNHDPGVPYIILAGNIHDYQVAENGRLNNLLEKIKVSVGDLVYGQEPNDIAVAVDSISGVDVQRDPSPVIHSVPCHHMNYFVNSDSLEILKQTLGAGNYIEN